MHQIPLLCLISSSLVLSQTPTVTPTPASSSDASSLITRSTDLDNPTLGIPVLLNGFDLSFEIGAPGLSRTACLMNAVAALKEQAVGNWDSKINDGTTFRLDSYREVSTRVTAVLPKRNI